MVRSGMVLLICDRGIAGGGGGGSWDKFSMAAKEGTCCVRGVEGGRRGGINLVTIKMN